MQSIVVTDDFDGLIDDSTDEMSDMMADKEVWLFWGTILLQLSGLLSVVALRVEHDLEGAWRWQAMFLASLFAVGLSTVTAWQAGNGLWTVSGAIVATMAVGATCGDAHRHRTAEL